LIYASQSTTEGDCITSILQASHHNNPALDITGMLYLSGGVFVQLLEGPEAAVMALYLKIRQDPRHQRCTLLFAEVCSNRLFHDWSMAYLHDIDELSLNFDALTGLRGSNDFGFITSNCLALLTGTALPNT
jgi:hypothetical protein